MGVLSTYSLIPLVSSLFVIILGFFVWFKKPREMLPILFFLYCFTIALWLFGTFELFNASTDADAIFWDRIIYIGVNFIPIFLYHFGLIYCGIKKQKIPLALGYILSFVFLPLTQTNYFVSGLFKYTWGVHTRAQGVHNFFLVYFFSYFIVFFVNLWIHYRRAGQERKKQVKPMLIGFLILDCVGPLAFLPAYGISIYPVVFLAAIPFVLLLAYAIIKHNALDLKTISTEVFITLIILVFGFELTFAQSYTEMWLRFLALASVVIFSIMLARSVKCEVRRREEIQKLAEQLNEANAKLQELDKLKSEFLSIAAHQLRTPLTVIKGYVSMIQEGDYGKLDNPKIETVLGNVYKSNEHLIYLVNDFLDVSRIEGGRTSYTFVKTDLAKVAEELVIEISLPVKEKGLQFKVEIAKNLPAVTVDAEKIRNVMWNFLTNAVKYTPKGWLKMELFKKGRQIVYQVTDNGIGLTKLDLENVYQKFYRAEEAKKITATGVGLGLFVCKKFIEAHKGEVFVASPGTGQGATFGFRLPIR